MLRKNLMDLIDWLEKNKIEYTCHWTDSQVWRVETEKYNYYVNYLDIIDEIRAV